MAGTPARSVRAGRLSPRASFGIPSVERGTQHWLCHVPALLVLDIDSASTSSKLISETGSIADLDIQDIDLDSSAVTAPDQVLEVPDQGSVKARPPLMRVRPSQVHQ